MVEYVAENFRGGVTMPYTISKKSNPLAMAAEFFATPEGKAFFLKECEKFRIARAEESEKVGQKECERV